VGIKMLEAEREALRLFFKTHEEKKRKKKKNIEDARWILHNSRHCSHFHESLNAQSNYLSH
jgi:hypothetical protein